MSYILAALSAFVMYGPRLDILSPAYELAATNAGGFAFVLTFCLAGADIAARVAFPGPRV